MFRVCVCTRIGIARPVNPFPNKTSPPPHHSIFQETLYRPRGGGPIPETCSLRVKYLPLHLYPYLPLPPTLASLPSASAAVGAFCVFFFFFWVCVWVCCLCVLGWGGYTCVCGWGLRGLFACIDFYNKCRPHPKHKTTKHKTGLEDEMGGEGEWEWDGSGPSLSGSASAPAAAAAAGAAGAAGAAAAGGGSGDAQFDAVFRAEVRVSGGERKGGVRFYFGGYVTVARLVVT